MILDTIEITLRGNGTTTPVFIDVYDTPLASQWLDALNANLKLGRHLEKNYCFLGFVESDRNLEFICDQLNQVTRTLIECNDGWVEYGLPSVDDLRYIYTPDNVRMSGEIGQGKPGGWPNHETLNKLHHIFETLQGTATVPSNYYANTNNLGRYAIRQLNLLCHEAESWCNSYRQSIAAPEWQRPSQLMCWLNSGNYILTAEMKNEFGIETLDREFGGVHIGINKNVGKSHYEVYTDEGPITDLDDLVCDVMIAQMIGTGDFDVDWGLGIKDREFHKNHVAGFKQWLTDLGLDYNDPKLTVGHPKVGQVDLMRSFGSTDINDIWPILNNHLDVSRVTTSQEVAIYDYRYTDYDFSLRQGEALG